MMQYLRESRDEDIQGGRLLSREVKGSVNECFNLLLMLTLQNRRQPPALKIGQIDKRTLLPVATELVGSLPAYNGYLPLWYCVWLPAV